MGLRAVICVLAIVSARAASAQEGGNPPESDSATFGTTVVIPGGLRGTIYLIPEKSTVLPDFEHDKLQRVGEVWTEALNIPPRHWRSGFPGLTDRFEWFAVDYNGRFWIDAPGRYTFALLSDDGSRLYLDKVPIIDNDCQHSPDLRIAAVSLEGGGHEIRVSYFQGPRDCLALILAIAGPNQTWHVFNTKDFSSPSDPEHWRYPAQSAMKIVPTTPQEASLSIHSFFRKLTESDPKERFVIKSTAVKGCRSYDPVRTCGQ